MTSDPDATTEPHDGTAQVDELSDDVLGGVAGDENYCTDNCFSPDLLRRPAATSCSISPR